MRSEALCCYTILGKTKSTFGWTALHMAVYFGHINVLEVLLSVRKLMTFQ